MNAKKHIAKLILEDGTVFTGYSFAHYGNTNGEVVFNTGMVGYPETLTDPSYRGQILVCTYPLIGNYGIPDNERTNGVYKNFESESIHIRALIISDYSTEYSHWSATRSLGDWLQENKIPGIYGIDTRMLTRKLRDKGTMLGKVIIDENPDVDFEDPNMTDLVSEVSIKKPVEYKAGKKKVVLVDCGTKNNIIQAFLGRNISIKRVPYNYDFACESCDGILLSNGPGDPKIKRPLRMPEKLWRKILPFSESVSDRKYSLSQQAPTLINLNMVTVDITSPATKWAPNAVTLHPKTMAMRLMPTL